MTEANKNMPSTNRREFMQGLLATGFSVTAAGVLVAGAWTAERLTRDVVDADTVAQWRERLAEQEQEVVSMRERTQAQTQAVGRQLAQMQSRLLRMEALGARVTEIADLDEGEERDPLHAVGDIAPLLVRRVEVPQLVHQMAGDEVLLARSAGVLDRLLHRSGTESAGSGPVRG